MSNQPSPASEQAPSPPTEEKHGPGKWTLWAGVLPAVAMVPFAFFLVADVWVLPATRGLLIALPLAAAFAYLRISAAEAGIATLRPRVISAAVLLAVAAIWYVFAVRDFSPSGACLAGIVALSAWALIRFGATQWAAIGAWSSLLALPCFAGWERGLSLWLRETSAWCTQLILDALEQPVLFVGGVVRIEGLEIPLTTVCGGVFGISLLLVLTIAMVILRKEGLLVGLFSIAAAPFFVWLMYLIRLTAISLAYAYYERNLVTGWDFRLLEIGSFVLALLFSWAFVHTLSVLFSPVPAADDEFGPFFFVMNKVLLWPQPDPFDSVVPTDPDEKREFLRRQEIKAARDRARKRILWNDDKRIKIAAIASGILFAGFSVLPYFVVLRGVWPRFASPKISQNTVEAITAADVAGTEGSDWQLIDGPVHDFDSAYGDAFHRSVVWSLRDGAETRELRITYPFSGWHDPAQQAVIKGWQMRSRRITQADDGWPVCVSELEDELGRAYVFSSLLKADRTPFSAWPDEGLASYELPESAGQSAGIGPLLSGKRRPRDVATMEVQLYCDTGRRLSRAEVAELEARFRDLRDSFVK